MKKPRLSYYLYPVAAAAAAKSPQSCQTLCDPIDGSPPGSPIPGILQARTLEWVAISFSSAWKWKVKVKSLSCVPLLAIPWTVAHQAPPSMGFYRQEYWSGVPLPYCYYDNIIIIIFYPAISTPYPRKFSAQSIKKRPLESYSLGLNPVFITCQLKIHRLVSSFIWATVLSPVK